MSDTILYEKKESIGYITINRPHALNALNQELLLELEKTITEIDADTSVKAVILTGAGSKAFVAGADIASMQAMTPKEAQEFSRLGQRVFNKIEKMRQIVIAAINGFALGGGCELAMACDIRIASSKSKMGIPEVTLGVFPGFAGTQRLPRLVGKGIAKEMLCTGKKISAEEAAACGLINHVVEEDALLPYCEKMAQDILKNSAFAISLGKKAINDGLEMELERAMEYEAALFAVAFSYEDQKEGMNAFLEKRKPNFK